MHYRCPGRLRISDGSTFREVEDAWRVKGWRPESRGATERTESTHVVATEIQLRGCYPRCRERCPVGVVFSRPASGESRSYGGPQARMSVAWLCG
jgi:hypothetical protein